MTKPISIDLRRRVCAAISEGLSCRKAAARFKLSASSAIRWQAQMKAAGKVRTFPAIQEAIRQLLTSYSDTECRNYLINSGYGQT
jgi:transposase